MLINKGIDTSYSKGKYILINESVSTSLPEGIYKETRDGDGDEFRALVKTWRAQTYYSSSIREMVEHPAFQKIVAMGKKVVPLIIEEIDQHPDFLVMALPMITGEDPIRDSDRGDVFAIAEAWVEWYNRQ